jgi:hypothetical protein
MKCLIELVTQDTDVISKVLPATLYGSACAWYHSLEPDSILHFHSLNTKLISHFSTSIPFRKSTIKLFVVTQREDESTRAYLQHFKEEMCIWKYFLNLYPQKLWLVEYTTILFWKSYTPSQIKISSVWNRQYKITLKWKNLAWLDKVTQSSMHVHHAINFQWEHIRETLRGISMIAWYF